MIMYTGGRRSGKTFAAIKLAFSTDSALIVASPERAKQIEYQAREMNYPIRVLTAKQYFDLNNMGRKRDIEKVIIDDIDEVLKRLFRCDVIMATTNGCTADIEIKEEEPDFDYKKWSMPNVKF